MEVESKKVYSDSLGNQTNAEINDWLEIGILGETQVNGEMEEIPIYLEKVLIVDSLTVFTVQVNQKPLKAGIDPMNKFIDRDSDDNLVRVSIRKKDSNETEESFRKLIQQGLEDGNMMLDIPNDIDQSRGQEIIQEELVKKFGKDVQIKMMDN